AAAEEERVALPLRRSDEQRQVCRVVPPVVVVEPADEITTRTADRGRAGVDLARSLVRDRGDSPVADAEGRREPVSVAVVDDDRLPVRLRLGEQARECP